MNAERLHAVARVLNQELNETKIVTKLGSMCDAFETVVNQPHPQHQENLANTLSAVRSALGGAASDSFSPAWRQMLQELGGEPLFGRSLNAAVEEILQRNQITPAVALKEFRELHKQVQAFKTAIEQLMNSLKFLKIGNEELESGECEIGMLIPRDAVENNLEEFADELKELSFILDVFSEVATGTPSDLSIKSISSSDLTVYLSACLPFAACLAVAVERVVALYKQLLEIKKLRNELSRQGVPKEQTTGIENYANDLMERGIDQLSVQIVQEFHQGKDGGRKNELTNGVRVSLRRIAERVDRGYNIEVRVAPQKIGQETTGDDNAAKIERIQAATKNMQFIKQEGAPILRLADRKEDRAARSE